VAGGGDDDGCIDGVGVHARLVIVMQGYEGPVCDNTGNVDGSVRVLARDEVLDTSGVEELDVREGEYFREES
jgi:hypothetical protein